ncbi:MAG: flavodoxin family protein [Candidatus Bathyarchaeia archaeon]|jgi:multimeric flavodoxin WrbA
MKACGIIGSPCKNGNVDVLVSQVLKGAASQGAETSKIYLNSLKIKPCQSCGVDPDPKHCLFNDDMKGVYDALETSDAIVLGSPVYFDTVSAQVKLMIDRSNCLMPYVKKADGTFGFERRVKKWKRGVFIAVAGTDQEFNVIMTTVKGFFNWTNTKLVETFFYSHDDNELGSIKNDKVRMKKAFDIGVGILERKLNSDSIR